MSQTQYPSVAIPPRLPLVVETSNRGASTKFDARLVNCYLETDKQNNLYIYRRPGLADYQTVAADTIGRGTYFWRGVVYSIFADTLYADGVSVGTGLDDTNGVYYFSEILGTTPKLVLGNGKKTYAYDTGSGLSSDLHTIDANYPTETTKGFAYLNGATYVGTSDAKIHGSKVNSVDQPGDWDPLDVIEAQIEPDPGVATNKQLVYAIAFNSWSTEVFFDAGNPSGSPLSPVQGSKASYGCANQDSIQQIDDVLFWVSVNRTASLQVAKMAQLTLKIISTPPIDRLLNDVDYSEMYSWQLKIDGHSFYVITFKNSNLTLAYDIVEEEWHQWTDVNGNYFPIVSSTYDADGNRVLQHENNGKLYSASTTTYQDLDQPIQVDIYTPEFDANTRRRKQLNSLVIIADQIEGSILYARCSDNNYQSWSNFRRIDLSQRKPRLTNCGTFEKRAYNFRHRSPTFFRISAVEVQYDVGTL